MGREEEPDRLAIPNTKRDKRGQSRISRDSVGAAVNRKVHGSNPCSGATILSSTRTHNGEAEALAVTKWSH